ncbi:unnamed protein product [Brassica napus]|uniref:(rape) hypothetical protein n=1 Tax=Brassica napus TaxID=3708 RepID=A0A816JYY1_BRANA|nr:unnamed protein product [Brassica napus]
MVEVIYDKTTGRSRGFGFVTMSTAAKVEAAAQQFNGYVRRFFDHEIFEGRPLRVNAGLPPPKREESFSRGPRSGGYGSERSSYGSERSGASGHGSQRSGRSGYGSSERSSYGSGSGSGSGSSDRVLATFPGVWMTWPWKACLASKEMLWRPESSLTGTLVDPRVLGL